MRREEVDLSVGLGNVRAGLADLLLRVEQGELLRDQLVHEVSKGRYNSSVLWVGSRPKGLQGIRERGWFSRRHPRRRYSACMACMAYGISDTRRDGDEGRREKRLIRNSSHVEQRMI